MIPASAMGTMNIAFSFHGAAHRTLAAWRLVHDRFQRVMTSYRRTYNPDPIYGNGGSYMMGKGYLLNIIAL